jgi:hypothetical protein
VLDRIIGVSAVLYALCTVALVPTMAQIDWLSRQPSESGDTLVLVALAIETVYSAAGIVLMAVWLVWFLGLHDWARARAIEVPDKAMAIAGCFVCVMNFFHPLRTLLKVRRATGVETPLALWWGLTWVSVVLATVRMPWLLRGGYDPLFVIASLMETVAVLLCWKITRDFRLADEDWDPRAELAQRK